MTNWRLSWNFSRPNRSLTFKSHTWCHKCIPKGVSLRRSSSNAALNSVVTQQTHPEDVHCVQSQGSMTLFSFILGRKKLRLFEYLHESLCNPEMASCIQWVDKSRGIFQFVSKNKEKLAQLWGKRKGNRKTMTYQKMARALRNYGRTGEITKIRRKLTYQFSEAILQRLSPSYFLEKEIFYSQYVQPDQGYLSLNNWNATYNYTYANCHELSHPAC